MLAHPGTHASHSPAHLCYAQFSRKQLTLRQGGEFHDEKDSLASSRVPQPALTVKANTRTASAPPRPLTWTLGLDWP